MPTVAVAGKADKSATISAPVVVIVVDAVLLAALPSLLALVVPLRVDAPTVVGVPETVQVIFAPAATVTGGVGAQTTVKPAGRPATVQVAAVALKAGAAALEQVKVPL